MATHYDIVHLTSVGSTQDEAARIAEANDRPTLVVAAHQVAGRGRSGRHWVEPDQALFSSYSFRPGWPPSTFPRLPLCAGVAIRRAIADGAGVTVDLKWPNDLLVASLKVGGILVEASGDRVTVGCGINLFWETPVEGAGALLDGKVDDAFVTSLGTRWVDGFVAVVDEGPNEWPRDAYLAACSTIGSEVAWDGGTGTAVDVDASGALVVRAADATTTVIAGDVHLLGRN